MDHSMLVITVNSLLKDGILTISHPPLITHNQTVLQKEWQKLWKTPQKKQHWPWYGTTLSENIANRPTYQAHQKCYTTKWFEVISRSKSRAKFHAKTLLMQDSLLMGLGFVLGVLRQLDVLLHCKKKVKVLVLSLDSSWSFSHDFTITPLVIGNGPTLTCVSFRCCL